MIKLQDMPADERAAYEDWSARRSAWFKESHPPHAWMKDYLRGARQKPGKV
jgi:hypothetical protein